MDFGRLPDLRYVDFGLPPDHPETARVLARARPMQPAPAKLFIGCPIWTNKEWLGSYFPLGIKEPDYLRYYAQQFNSIELNTTHYRIPDATTVRRWREAVGPDSGFKFCPKLPRSISHERELFQADDLVVTTARAFEGLGDNLGWAFLQLPPHFGPEHLPRLERFLVDFHGLHSTDYQRADAWAERIAAWVAQGVHEVYFFIHQKDVRHAPIFTQYLLEKLKLLTGIAVPPPRIIPQAVQGSLFG
jgi:uncharacterized protein YecE (DUF72 family)